MSTGMSAKPRMSAIAVSNSSRDQPPGAARAAQNMCEKRILRHSNEMPACPPGAYTSPYAPWTPETLYEARPWVFISAGALLGIGATGWSLAVGYWTVWRGLSMFAGAALCDRRRDHSANAPGLSRTQQAAPGVLAIMRTAVIGVGYLGRFHAQKYR